MQHRWRKKIPARLAYPARPSRIQKRARVFRADIPHPVVWLCNLQAAGQAKTLICLRIFSARQNVPATMSNRVDMTGDAPRICIRLPFQPLDVVHS
jgi:hypothetical protein